MLQQRKRRKEEKELKVRSSFIIVTVWKEWVTTELQIDLSLHSIIVSCLAAERSGTIDTGSTSKWFILWRLNGGKAALWPALAQPRKVAVHPEQNCSRAQRVHPPTVWICHGLTLSNKLTLSQRVRFLHVEIVFSPNLRTCIDGHCIPLWGCSRGSICFYIYIVTASTLPCRGIRTLNTDIEAYRANCCLYIVFILRHKKTKN